MPHFMLDGNAARMPHLNDTPTTHERTVKNMARGDAQMRIRVPDDVKAWLAEQAKQNLRTQAAQVVVALRAAMTEVPAEQK